MSKFEVAFEDVFQSLQNSYPNTRKILHCITNYVSAEAVANAVLACGGSPIMADSPDEVDDVTSICDALAINIGTPSVSKFAAIELSYKIAIQRKIPIIIDPVGCATTRYRLNFLHSLLSLGSPTLIRGNANEIFALLNGDSPKVGIDSIGSIENVKEIALALALKHHCIVVVSGKIDFITNGIQVYRIHNGHENMSRITGMGCALTAITGLFLAHLPSNPIEAALIATAFFGYCGEIAGSRTNALGSFYTHFWNELSTLNPLDQIGGFRIESIS